jgi:hypothetical protein
MPDSVWFRAAESEVPAAPVPLETPVVSVARIPV